MGKKELENIEIIRHSLSHILAAAVLKMFPDAKLGIGPAIEKGFYYDFDLPRTLKPEDLPKIEKEMRKLIEQKFDFKKTVEIVKEAEKELKKSQPYKAELVADLAAEGEKEVSFYQSGGFSDLCAGPHVSSTADLRKVGFKLDKIAGAYWKGSEKNKMLQRIYALAFETQKELDEYLVMMAEAEREIIENWGRASIYFHFMMKGPVSLFGIQKE